MDCAGHEMHQKSCILFSSARTLTMRGAHKNQLLLQVANSGAWGYALLDFRPEAILFELWLFNIAAPRTARLNIGIPGMVLQYCAQNYTLLVQLHPMPSIHDCMGRNLTVACRCLAYCRGVHVQLVQHVGGSCIACTMCAAGDNGPVVATLWKPTQDPAPNTLAAPGLVGKVGTVLSKHMMLRPQRSFQQQALTGLCLDRGP